MTCSEEFGRSQKRAGCANGTRCACKLDAHHDIREGRSNGSIATSLGITKRAVERHINAIFLKLDLREAEDVSRRVKAVLLYLGR